VKPQRVIGEIRKSKKKTKIRKLKGGGSGKKKNIDYLEWKDPSRWGCENDGAPHRKKKKEET